MRYIFIEITEAHAAALEGRTKFHISVPERCQVQCVVKVCENEPPEHPAAELLKLTYEKLSRIYTKGGDAYAEKLSYANELLNNLTGNEVILSQAD